MDKIPDIKNTSSLLILLGGEIVALAETALKSAIPKDKAYKLMDNDGLYAEVRPTGVSSSV